MSRFKLTIASGAVVAVFIPLMAFAAALTLFGGATITPGNEVLLVSDLSNADPNDDFSGIRLAMPAGTTLSELTSLSTNYNVTDDDCFGGSPRFQLRMDTDGDSIGDGNIFVYLGPVPNFSGCAAGLLSSGNLIGSLETRYDLTQFGGAFYSTYADAIALLGTDDLLRVTLVVDSGWGFGDGEQEILVDNINVNGTLYDFEPPTSKDQCKNGGWQLNPVFKNQGDCVSFVASKGKANGNP